MTFDYTDAQVLNLINLNSEYILCSALYKAHITRSAPMNVYVFFNYCQRHF